MRRLIALLALAGLAGSPAVAQTRLFCRFTGAEITGCEEAKLPAAPVVREADCCERRVSRPLAETRPSAASLLAAPVLAALPLAPRPLLAPAPAARAEARGTAGAGPPLFVQHRALLL